MTDRFRPHFFSKRFNSPLLDRLCLYLFLSWKWLLGFLLLLALLAWINESIGWRQTLSIWSNVSWSILIGSFCLFFFSHLIRAYRIFEYSRSDFLGRYQTALKISSFHQLANNFLPMRMGEAVYPVLMRRYLGKSWAEGATRLFYLRLLDLWVAGSVLSFVAFSLLLGNALISLTLCFFLSLIVYMAWVFLFLPLISTGKTPHFITYLTNRWKSLAPMLSHIQLAFKLSKTESFRLIAWTWLSWASKLMAYSLLLAAMTDLSPLVALSAAFFGEMSSLLPIHGIAGAGTFEAAFVLGAQAHSGGMELVIAAAVNIHVFVLFVSLVLALICMPIKTISYDRTYTQSV